MRLRPAFGCQSCCYARDICRSRGQSDLLRLCLLIASVCHLPIPPLTICNLSIIRSRAGNTIKSDVCRVINTATMLLSAAVLLRGHLGSRLGNGPSGRPSCPGSRLLSNYPRVVTAFKLGNGVSPMGPNNLLPCLDRGGAAVRHGSKFSNVFASFGTCPAYPSHPRRTISLVRIRCPWHNKHARRRHWPRRVTTLTPLSYQALFLSPFPFPITRDVSYKKMKGAAERTKGYSIYETLPHWPDEQRRRCWERDSSIRLPSPLRFAGRLKFPRQA